MGERRISSKQVEVELQRISRNVKIRSFRLAENASVTSKREERETTHPWVLVRSRFGGQVNSAGEAHYTSYHLAHSFLCEPDAGCSLLEVAYGRILEGVVRTGSHPLVPGCSLSGPCWRSHRTNAHNIREGVQMKKASTQGVSLKLGEDNRCYSSRLGSPHWERGVNNSRLKHQVRE